MKNLTLLTLLITNIVFSQDTIDTSKINEIDVIGIRATSKNPITQKTITSNQISKTYQGQEMTYILSNTPSVNFSSDGGHSQGYTSFRLRGIDQTRVNMTLNGVCLNEPEDQGVYFSNYPMFAKNIQSMQIQRGVGTSSNGTASYAGSINFESKNGIDTTTNLEFGYGSFNTSRLIASTSTGISKNGFAAYGNLSAYNSNGYKYNSGGSGYSGFLGLGLYKPKNILKLTAFSGLSLNKMAWFAVSESDIKKDPRINYNPKGENDNFTQSFIQIQNIRKFNEKHSLTTTAFYNKLIGTWGMYSDSVNLMNFGLNSNFVGALTNYYLKLKKLDLNIGLLANTYSRQHDMHFNSDKTKVYSNIGYKNELSSYIKLSYNIGKLTLFTDAQIRNVNFKYAGDVPMNNLNWTFFNPKGGVNFRQNKNISYYFSVGQSHREPTRTDMFGGNDNLTTLNIITPERVLDYELGSYINYNKLKIQTNIFYMDFKNEITLLGALGFNGLPLMTNVTKSYRSGLELDLSYKLNKHITLLNNSSFMKCQITNNSVKTAPLYTPNFIVNQAIEYNNKGLFISVSAKYHSKSYIDFSNTSTIPQFLTLNCNFGYKLSYYTLQFNLNNITNKRYYTNGYLIGNEKFLFVNAPINLGLTLKAEF